MRSEKQSQPRSALLRRPGDAGAIWKQGIRRQRGKSGRDGRVRVEDDPEQTKKAKAIVNIHIFHLVANQGSNSRGGLSHNSGILRHGNSWGRGEGEEGKRGESSSEWRKDKLK